MRKEDDEEAKIQVLDEQRFQSVIRLSELSSESDSEPEGTNIGRGYPLLYFSGEKQSYRNGSTEFTLDEQTLSDMVQNFHGQVAGQALAANYNHNLNGEAAGWIQDVYLDDWLYS